MICADTEERIRANTASVRARIGEAAQRAGRSPASVTLLPVTKTVGVEEIDVLKSLGFHVFGENRVDVARPKIEHFGEAIQWHMVGRIQRRKARDVVELFSRVDAVDRIPLAEALSKRAVEQGKTLEVLLEMNVSGEDAKAGFSPLDLPEALDAIRALPALSVRGLMTMAPYTEDVETTRPVFAALRKLADTLQLSTLSMGMTNDFEVAIEEGATEVRIGTALFEQAPA